MTLRFTLTVDSPSLRFFVSSIACSRPDLIVEVAHPEVTKMYGPHLLSICSMLFGSPTAFADPDIEGPLMALARQGPHALWIPAGALWGAIDILKMADRGTLKASSAASSDCK